jgi:hypothetical protein
LTEKDHEQLFCRRICTLILLTRNMPSGYLVGSKILHCWARNAVRNLIRDVMEMLAVHPPIAARSEGRRIRSGCRRRRAANIDGRSAWVRRSNVYRVPLSSDRED